MSAPRGQRCTGITEGHERVQGQVKWYDAVKGYGFIGRENDKDVFVHLTAIYSEDVAPRHPVLKNNEKVEFYIAETEKGIEAREVTLENGAIVPKRALRRFPRRYPRRNNRAEESTEAKPEGEAPKNEEGKPEKKNVQKRRRYRKYRKNNKKNAEAVEAKPAEEKPAEAKPAEEKPAESN